MSGSVVKVSGFTCTSGAAVATGATLAFRWNAYPASAGAAELQLQGSTDNGATWQAWHRVAATATNSTKGGLPDGAWLCRIVARRNSAEMPGSASDPVTVRVGPAPVVQPTPTPTPAPAPTYATAADLAALASRVAAIEGAAMPAKLDALAARVAALEAAGIRPADLPRVGASTAAEEMVVVRAGEIVVATRG